MKPMRKTKKGNFMKEVAFMGMFIISLSLLALSAYAEDMYLAVKTDLAPIDTSVQLEETEQGVRVLLTFSEKSPNTSVTITSQGGQLVKTLAANENFDKGKHLRFWKDGLDDQGKAVQTNIPYVANVQSPLLTHSEGFTLMSSAPLTEETESEPTPLKGKGKGF